jgi:hypothetical protein
MQRVEANVLAIHKINPRDLNTWYGRKANSLKILG